MKFELPEKKTRSPPLDALVPVMDEPLALHRMISAVLLSERETGMPQ